MQYLKTYDDLILEKIEFKTLLNKIKNAHINKKRVIKSVLAILLSLYSLKHVENIIANNSILPYEDKELSLELLLKDENYKNGYDFILSQEGWDDIRREENLRLKAYRIGDGMITVGYGHAEPIKNSKLKVGYKITKDQAELYLKNDLNNTANGIRRIFKQWKQKGIDVKITQNQFDVLVSLAYNMGLTDLRTSDFIQLVKQNRLKDAAEKIKTLNVEDKFPGLKDRRIREYLKFSEDL